MPRRLRDLQRSSALAGEQPSCVRRPSPDARRIPTRRRHTQALAGAIVAVATVAGLMLLPSAAQAGGARLDRTERKVVKFVNRYRAKHGRPRVHVSRRLNRVADRHSREMARHNFFAHASRNGTAAATRVRRSTNARAVGENLAFVSSRRSAARRVVNMWIRSDGHRAVLLSGSFRRIGVGRRSGRLGGSWGHHFTADFASRH